MPWQLTPASQASVAQGENTIVSYVPGYGFMRGTMQALRFIYTPLPVGRGRNETVDACQTVVASAAAALGAVRVEASSAGPQTRTPEGYVAPVAFRILYARNTGSENLEVRAGVLSCKVDRAGKILDATA
ncbi:hypothetical protein [Methylobacterium crusticola]|nr:hypothetical protein [Methylobacterium crusticola]